MLLNVLVGAVLVGSALYFAPTTGDSSYASGTDGFSAAANFDSNFSEDPVSYALFLLWGFYCLLAFIPGIAVTVRRLHDRDMRGWWYLLFILLGLIPLIGTLISIAFFVLLLLPGTAGDNRFGSDPKGENYAVVFE